MPCGCLTRWGAGRRMPDQLWDDAGGCSRGIAGRLGNNCEAVVAGAPVVVSVSRVIMVGMAGVACTQALQAWSQQLPSQSWLHGMESLAAMSWPVCWPCVAVSGNVPCCICSQWEALLVVAAGDISATAHAPRNGATASARVSSISNNLWVRCRISLKSRPASC